MNKDAKRRMTAFKKGFASAFDISGFTLVEHREILGGFERDKMMLKGDWERIGIDVREAMDVIANEQ